MLPHMWEIAVDTVESEVDGFLGLIVHADTDENLDGPEWFFLVHFLETVNESIFLLQFPQHALIDCF